MKRGILDLVITLLIAVVFLALCGGSLASGLRGTATMAITVFSMAGCGFLTYWLVCKWTSYSEAVPVVCAVISALTLGVLLANILTNLFFYH